MHKYIEELMHGDSFIIDNDYFVLTTDFKKNGSRLAVSLQDGNSRWFDSTTIVEPNQLYLMDKDNNIIPIKITEKENVATQS